MNLLVQSNVNRKLTSGAQLSERLQILAIALVQVNCRFDQTKMGRNHFVWVALSARLYQMRIHQLAKQGRNHFSFRCLIQS